MPAAALSCEDIFGPVPEAGQARLCCDAADRDEFEERLVQLRTRYDARLWALQQEYTDEASAVCAFYAPESIGKKTTGDGSGEDDGLLMYSPSAGWREQAAESPPGSTQAETKKRPRDIPAKNATTPTQPRKSTVPAPATTAANAAAETMPNFGAMDVAELKRRVKEFGMKVSGKKVMVRQLTEIWERQHGLVRSDDATPDSGMGRPQAPTSSGHSASKQRGRQQRVGAHSATEARGTCGAGVDRSLALQVRAFVMARPEWYTPVLLLDAIDMRGLHAALSVEASTNPSRMAKCSLKQLELILREQALCFQAEKAP